MSEANRVIVVGSGHGGVQAVASLRQRGYAGRINLVSDETDLPYHKPPLSKTFLKSPDALSQALRPERFYIDNEVELDLGRRVTEIDRHAGYVHLQDGRKIGFSNLVLAMGARPRWPQIDGIDLDGVFALRGFADAERLRAAVPSAQSVVVVGGGFIGMEIAHTLVGLGKAVIVLEAAPSCVGRAVAPAISRYAERHARDAGIEVRTGSAVRGLDGRSGHVTAVRLADGSTLPVDLVIVATGVVPNTELASGAGLNVENGIVVDQSLRTSDPRIFALGDVATFEHWHARRPVRLESVQNASDHAKHIARAISGEVAPYREVPWFWSDQGSMKLQMSGIAFDADREVVSGNPAEKAFSVWRFAGSRLLSVDSINRPSDHMVARRLLAADISPSDEDIAGGATRLKARLDDVRCRDTDKYLR